jgi:hypothetical protein
MLESEVEIMSLSDSRASSVVDTIEKEIEEEIDVDLSDEGIVDMQLKEIKQESSPGVSEEEKLELKMEDKSVAKDFTSDDIETSSTNLQETKSIVNIPKLETKSFPAVTKLSEKNIEADADEEIEEEVVEEFEFDSLSESFEIIESKSVETSSMNLHEANSIANIPKLVKESIPAVEELSDKKIEPDVEEEIEEEIVEEFEFDSLSESLEMKESRSEDDVSSIHEIDSSISPPIISDEKVERIQSSSLPIIESQELKESQSDDEISSIQLETAQIEIKHPTSPPRDLSNENESIADSPESSNLPAIESSEIGTIFKIKEADDTDIPDDTSDEESSYSSPPVVASFVNKDAEDTDIPDDTSDESSSISPPVKSVDVENVNLPVEEEMRILNVESRVDDPDMILALAGVCEVDPSDTVIDIMQSDLPEVLASLEDVYSERNLAVDDVRLVDMQVPVVNITQIGVSEISAVHILAKDVYSEGNHEDAVQFTTLPKNVEKIEYEAIIPLALEEVIETKVTSAMENQVMENGMCFLFF